MGHPDTAVLEEFHMLGAAETMLGNIAHLPTARRTSSSRPAAPISPSSTGTSTASFPGLIVDKLPLNMLGLPVIHSLFPDARIIFAQRHPCDAVLSGFMQSFTLNDAMACFLTIDGGRRLYDAAMSLFTREP